MALIFDAVTDLGAYLVKDTQGNIREFKHRQSVRIPLFPYNTKMEPKLASSLKPDLKNFDGFIGQCYRLIQGKDFPKKLRDAENYKEELKNQILEAVVAQASCEDDLLDKLKAIVDSLFFNENNLVKYGPKALGYMNWNKYDSGLQKKAIFFRSIFFDTELENLLIQESEGVEHILNRLVNASLPLLEDNPEGKSYLNYFRLDQTIISQFRKDFKLLAAEKKNFLSESEKLFKFYYFLYIARAAYKLNDFFSPEEHNLFFTLEEETVSSTRRTFANGWRQLEMKVETIFAHAVCLDLLNHIPISQGQEVYDYVGLKKLYHQADPVSQNDLIGAVEAITAIYCQSIPPLDDQWKDFEDFYTAKLKRFPLESRFEEAILALWCRIEYQFIHSTRNKPRKNYANWFIYFCKENFLKGRGRNGYTLNLTHDMLLFLTKLCLGTHSKIRLKDLWQEFQKRGINFDDATRQAIIEVYEKINLIEKKSDSGDAQYVRSIL